MEYCLRRQAIIWTNTETLLIALLGANFSEILSNSYIVIQKNVLKMWSVKRLPFFLGLIVLMHDCAYTQCVNSIALSYQNIWLISNDAITSDQGAI